MAGFPEKNDGLSIIFNYQDPQKARPSPYFA